MPRCRLRASVPISPGPAVGRGPAAQAGAVRTCKAGYPPKCPCCAAQRLGVRGQPVPNGPVTCSPRSANCKGHHSQLVPGSRQRIPAAQEGRGVFWSSLALWGLATSNQRKAGASPSCLPLLCGNDRRLGGHEALLKMDPPFAGMCWSQLTPSCLIRTSVASA